MQRIYYINELAGILGLSPASIHAHLARQNYKAVPQPIKLGHRLAWPAEVLDTWIAEQIEAHQASQTRTDAPRRGRGRPRKGLK